MVGYIFHMRRTLYANLIGRIAFFTGENIAHIEFYLQGLLPKILAIYTTRKRVPPAQVSAQPRTIEFLWQNFSAFFQCDDFFEEISKLPTNKDLAFVTVPFSLMLR